MSFELVETENLFKMPFTNVSYWLAIAYKVRTKISCSRDIFIPDLTTLWGCSLLTTSFNLQVNYFNYLK